MSKPSRRKHSGPLTSSGFGAHMYASITGYMRILEDAPAGLYGLTDRIVGWARVERAWLSANGTTPPWAIPWWPAFHSAWSRATDEAGAFRAAVEGQDFEEMKGAWTRLQAAIDEARSSVPNSP